MPVKYPGIPAIVTDKDIRQAIEAIKEAVEILTGQRLGALEGKAMTQEEVDKRIKQLVNPTALN